MSKLPSTFLCFLALITFSANANVNNQIGDNNYKFQIVSRSALKQKSLKTSSIVPATSAQAIKKLMNLPQGQEAAPSIIKAGQKFFENDNSLLIGLPLGLIGEHNIFGGVITKVSDKKNETLGTLKLTDLSPLNVRTVITGVAEGTPGITLVGCAFKCDESSQQGALITLPIAGYNQETEMILVDMAAIGKELDLISMLDPDGEYTQLKAISSATTKVEYSYSTLVFDITTTMIPVTAIPGDASAPKTEFTVRWYLKLNSAFNPAFTARSATEGVGFFQTERSAEPKITRFSTTANGSTVQYYLKNIPENYKKVFAKALDNWNVEFNKVIGRDLISYEFVEAGSPEAEALIPGDIRYNIIEWDLVNKASYGGLGPSIANQFTGETLSANVLIQGPTIIDLYTKWYEVSQKARKLEPSLANKMLAEFNKEASAVIEKRKGSFKLKLGKSLEMTVHAQRAALEDPMIKTHFEIFPEGVSFEEYMTGYFTEILEHELGHNLGLRHNFKGNLGAYESREAGSVSRSVMEYLGRPYRHLNSIGLYDKMAIAYGYKGVKPKHLDWFCTDEDGVSETNLIGKSAECTKSDATSDPFSFFEERLARNIELLVDTHSTSAPVWTASELTAQIDETVVGFASYAASAAKTAHTWSNFFGKGDRPDEVSEVKNYVLARFKKQFCSPDLAVILNEKESTEARELAQKNLDEIEKRFIKLASSAQIFTSEQIKCD